MAWLKYSLSCKIDKKIQIKIKENIHFLLNYFKLIQEINFYISLFDLKIII